MNPKRSEVVKFRVYIPQEFAAMLSKGVYIEGCKSSDAAIAAIRRALPLQAEKMIEIRAPSPKKPQEE